MIEVDGLTKYYGRFPAIKDVKFRIETGEIVGFLGPNGAGKTTTMRILTCYSPPSSGTARVLGMDVTEDSFRIRKNIGYLPENVPLYDGMRVREYLRFVTRSKAIPGKKRNDEVNRVAAAVGIEQVLGKTIANLSKGFRQRVGLAQALVGDPAILILDEPTIGLDPRQIREIRRLIKGFARDRTVILSTHILPEVSQVCDRVIIINKGSIVAEDTPSNLTGAHGASTRVRMILKADPDDATRILGSLADVERIEVEQSRAGLETVVNIEGKPETEIRPLLTRTIVENGWDLLELRSVDVSLEDVFIDLVTEERTEVTAPASSDAEEVA